MSYKQNVKSFIRTHPDQSMMLHQEPATRSHTQGTCKAPEYTAALSPQADVSNREVYIKLYIGAHERNIQDIQQKNSNAKGKCSIIHV